jgi:hypothetical protein
MLASTVGGGIRRGGYGSRVGSEPSGTGSSCGGAEGVGGGRCMTLLGVDASCSSLRAWSFEQHVRWSQHCISDAV